MLLALVMKIGCWFLASDHDLLVSIRGDDGKLVVLGKVDDTGVHRLDRLELGSRHMLLEHTQGRGGKDGTGHLGGPSLGTDIHKTRGCG